MDKLRALQYFTASAAAGSFSGAARSMDVSVPAVARLVTMLERSLGVALFERTSHGLTLTADGAAYLEKCRPAMRQLLEADEAITGAMSRAHGTLVVGVPPILSQHCLLPALPAFHARYPDIQLDIRTVDRPAAPAAQSVEVMVLYGWPEHPGLVQRRIALTRLLVCASPAYWAAHGVPQRPRDLESHACLLFRDQEGTILDAWEYEREGVKEAAAVSGWMVSTHRDVIMDAAVAGLGVARFTDLTVRNPLRSGQLVPVLLDWETKQSPPISLLYRAHQRRTPRVRLFVDFVTQLFAQLEREREPAVASMIPAERPHWYKRRHARASTSARRPG
ncbi:MAG: LysR substrate-binding domain-containing protein [Usitatibacter sp.]